MKRWSVFTARPPHETLRIRTHINLSKSRGGGGVILEMATSWF